MKFLHLPIYLTSAACLFAQTPPAAQPAAPAQPAGKPPAVTLQPAAPVVAQVPPDKVVLTIGDEKVTAGEIDRMIEMIPEQYRNQMRTTGRRQFADNIIRLKVMAQEARRRKLDETPAYKQQLAFQGEQLLAQSLYQNLLTTTKVDDAAARAYYDQHKSEYEMVKAHHILIRVKGSPVPLRKDQKDLTDEEALAKAKDIRKKLVDGADFATLAKAESDDVGSGANGGDVGEFGHGRMVAPFEQAALSLPIGQISEPVKSQFGYHIIRVDERKTKTFDEVRADIEKKLPPEIARKTMDDLKNNVSVVMDPEYFGPAPQAPAAPTLGPPPAAKAPPTAK